MRGMHYSLIIILLMGSTVGACTAPPVNSTTALNQYPDSTLCEVSTYAQENNQSNAAEIDPLIQLIGDILRVSVEVMFRAGGEIVRVRR